MDETPLERSIREESERIIEDIRRKEAEEIARLEERYAAEIETLRRRKQAETDRRIEQELSRIEHREVLDRKKMALRMIENFIHRSAVEALKEMRRNFRYTTYLKTVVCEALDAVTSDAEIRVRKEDLALGKESIDDALKVRGRNGNIALREDNSIEWGGCSIVDGKTGRILNGTIERIYFRRSQAIRLEVMNILKKYGLKDEAEGR